MTPLQLLNSYATIANGGVLLKPEITERIIAPDGTVIEAQPETVRRVVSEATANEVGKMLRSVVVNGHGKRADVPGYLVVGKTGTAQVAKPGGGYEEDTSIGSFAGYAPLNDPKFVVLVKIDHPRDVEWAESSAAPTFGKDDEVSSGICAYPADGICALVYEDCSLTLREKKFLFCYSYPLADGV